MSITLNLNQARELLEFFGGEDATVALGRCGTEAHSGPGLYAWIADQPAEGSIKLDEEPETTDGVSGMGDQTKTPHPPTDSEPTK